MPKESSNSERRYYFINDLNDIIKCPVCGKRVKYSNTSHRIRMFCSIDCYNTEIGQKLCEEKKKIKTKNKCGSGSLNFKNTFKEKYGVDNPLKVKKFIEKSLKTKKSHGKEYNDMIREKINVTKRKKNFKKFKEEAKNKNIEILFSIEDFVYARCGQTLKFKCLVCDEEFEYKLSKGNTLSMQYVRCPNQIHKHTSKAENEIYEWLKSLRIENIVRNKRFSFNNKNMEADIFLPDYNLVIEYNGLYWHSNLYRDKDYHYNKWKFFKDMNIQCIQIFDNEWNNKKDIVKSIILRTLKILKNDIIESDCEVREIESDLFNKFVNENYINMRKGINHSNSVIGLFNKSNELLECISLSNISNNNWRIDLYCCDIRNNYSHFGLNKMIESFKSKNKIDSIEMTLDNRYFSPLTFKDKGFELYEIDKPKRYYFSKNNYEFITNFKSLNIQKYDESLNEEELATINNYMWVYDSGRQIIIKNIKAK